MQVRVFVLLCLLGAQAAAQKIPDVRCALEDYRIDAVIYWQAPFKTGAVQVAVLEDPAGEQEARFDLTYGASLVSLRYKGKELLYGQTAGAALNLWKPRAGTEAELKGMQPYWSSFNPSQGYRSMDTPATVAGVACNGKRSLRAFAMMVDRAVNSSFQQEPLLAVWQGKISDSFPPGYTTPFAIETNASWVRNPAGSPEYYLKFEQSVVNVRAEATGELEWFLEGAAPWESLTAAAYPENCTEKSPCRTGDVKALVAGRYRDASRTDGFALAVPTEGWGTGRAFVRENAEFVVLAYGAVWAAPRHAFATVLTHALAGTSAHRYAWYVCAGGWEQAKAFAAAGPR